MTKSKQNLVIARLTLIFAAMEKMTSILLKQAVYIQIAVVLLAIGIFQCAQNKEKSPAALETSASQQPIEPNYEANLTEETKRALAQLADSNRIEGDLGEQLIRFISANVMDFGDQFKFIGLRWDGRTAKVVETRRSEIDDLTKIMLLFPKMKIRLESYVDSEGNPKKDEELTQARVDFIKNELTAAGIEASRIEAKGFGQKYPVGDNKTELGRMINNRVELYLTKL